MSYYTSRLNSYAAASAGADTFLSHYAVFTNAQHFLDTVAQPSHPTTFDNNFGFDNLAPLPPEFNFLSGSLDGPFGSSGAGDGEAVLPADLLAEGAGLGLADDRPNFNWDLFNELLQTLGSRGMVACNDTTGVPRS